jgi:ribosomal protein S7
MQQGKKKDTEIILIDKFEIVNSSTNKLLGNPIEIILID